jgi:HEAT repeat protein
MPTARCLLVRGSILAVTMSVFSARALAYEEVTPAKEAKAATPAVPKEALRYDGKPFEYWKNYLLTELKPERRVEALRALVHFGRAGYGSQAAKAIVRAVQQCHAQSPDSDEKEPDVPSAASMALGKIGLPAVPALVEALKDKDKDVQVYAAGVLSWRFDPLPKKAVPALVRAALDPDPVVRSAAVDALSSARAADIERALRRALADPRESRQLTRTLVGMVKMRPSEHGPELCPDGWSAIRLLGKIGPPAHEGVGPLLSVVRTWGNNQYLHRDDAVKALGRIQAEPQPVVSALAAALKDYEPDVRTAAAQALALFGPKAKAAAPALRDALRSPVPVQMIVEGAGMAAIVPASANVVATAGQPLQEQEWCFRLEVACALGCTGDDARPVTPIFLDTFKTVNGEGRQQMLQSIGEHGASAAVFVPALLKAYKQYPENRPGIATALGGIGPAAKDALPVLKEAAQDKDPTVRQAAAAAVRKITRGK